jgi:acyl dehydratase
MPIDPQTILQVRSTDMRVDYADREVMLYALGIGFGHDPLDERELPFVLERNLRTMPTMATTLGWRTDLAGPIGIDFSKVLQTGQSLTLSRPLPTAASVVVGERVIGAFDKGRDKGALLRLEKTIRDAVSGELLCSLVATILARADGGFGGPREGAPSPHPLPGRVPDIEIECTTRPDQALLYALSGDRNPLHRNPALARSAGFERPILQGLCTYGIACKAIVTGVCDYASERISAFDARFSAAVFPGETVVTDIWVDGSVVSFRSRVKERGIVALDNGRCVTGFQASFTASGSGSSAPG